jgi:hypothetical protein
VLLILRPNVLAFGWEATLPLVAALAMACLFILNRRVGGLAPVIVMQFVVAVMALPILFALAVFGHLSGDPAQVVTWPHWSVVLRCAIVAVTATLGHWCIFRATELASAATIAPMTYVQLLVAVPPERCSSATCRPGPWPAVDHKPVAKQFTLPNGLKVDLIFHIDRSDPVVAVSLHNAAHVGSARELPGRTGFAHCSSTCSSWNPKISAKAGSTR